jgi:thiol-disulfide isomerase/thioredoxin
MKKVVLTLVVLFGIVSAFREFRPAPRFGSARSAFQVERLGNAGDVVREEFEPGLAPYLAVYHGASWCGPCQRFSPRLAEFYRDADKTKLRFQLLMVNYDRSDEDMVAYMRQHKMEFPAVRRGDAGKWGASTGDGIPNLIIIDTATGKVVTSSFEGATYVGCEKPLGVLLAIIAKGHP